MGIDYPLVARRRQGAQRLVGEGGVVLREAVERTGSAQGARWFQQASRQWSRGCGVRGRAVALGLRGEGEPGSRGEPGVEGDAGEIPWEERRRHRR